QHRVPHVVGGIGELGASGDPRVVDEDQRLAQVFLYSRNHVVDLASLGDVADDGGRARTNGTDGAHRLLENVSRATADRDLGAPMGQGKREGTADSPATAGDESDAAGQIPHANDRPGSWSVWEGRCCPRKR